MKKTLLIAVVFLFAISIKSQTYFIKNTVGLKSSALGSYNTSSGDESFVSGNNSFASGSQSTALGLHVTASGMTSCSFGAYNIADGAGSVAIGSRSSAMGTGAITIGNKLDALGQFSYVIGIGKPNNYLQNNINYSLMMGFNSNVPTFFVGPSANVDSSGKIGIGNITAPEAKLHIKADASENADLFLDPRNASNFAILKLGSENNRIEAKQISDLSFYTNQDFYFANGEVGIGTSTPSALLDVNGDLRIREIARFDNYVGMGTSSPDEQLHVIGNQILNGSLNVSSSSTFDSDITIGGNQILNGSLNVISSASFDNNITVAGNQTLSGTLHVTSAATFDNNITINGNQLLTGSLQVSSSSTFNNDISVSGKTTTNTLSISEGAVTGKFLQSSDNDGNVQWVDVSMEDNDWDISGNNVYKTIGKVGIGTNSFSGDALLKVDGKFEAEEIEVKTISKRDVGEWKDYVFEDTYNLLTIEEVELFIKENGHLPDIPSEEEVIQNGYDMGEMDALLLQKIEELTLYIIELEKKINYEK